MSALPSVEFWVPGVPAPAGSKRAFYIRKIKRAVVTDDCKRSKPWQADVKFAAYAAWGQRPPLEGPVRLEIVFRLPRPKGHYGSRLGCPRIKDSAPAYPAGKPDATKLLRAVEDALTGIVWRDDAQIVHQTVEKVYGERAGAMIRVAPEIAPACRRPDEAGERPLPLLQTTEAGKETT